MSVVKLGVLPLLLAAGTACRDRGPAEATFFPSIDGRDVKQTSERQIALGAQQDAMLRDLHFTSRGELNSLGRWKLDQILIGTEPVVVFLPDTPRPAYASRKAAVLAYATDHNRLDVDVQEGVNRSTLHLAGPELAHLDKTDSTGVDEVFGPVRGESPLPTPVATGQPR